MTGRTATFRIWRGDARGGTYHDYPTEVTDGMVVLDAVHQIQAVQANDLAVRWNCKAGKCGSCSAEVNGNPRLMCMTRLNDLPLDKPVGGTDAGARWSGPGDRRFVELPGNHQEVPAAARMRRTERGGCAGRRGPRSGIPKVHQCFLCQDVCHVLREHHLHEEFIGPRLLVYVTTLEMHPLDVEPDERAPERHGISYCNITKLHESLPEDITIAACRHPLKAGGGQFYDPLRKLLGIFRSRT
jgi:succinate dehydrogenase / fumarate reductase iron-sulfur subunit